MKNIIPFVGYFFFIISDVSAQFSIINRGKEIDYPKSGIQYMVVDGVDLTNDALRNNLNTNWLLLRNRLPALKNREQTIWLKIPVGLLNGSRIKWLQIKDPNINFLHIWVVKNDSLVREFSLTGDHLPFHSRQINAADFIFPFDVDLYKNCSLIISADKRHTSKLLPIHFLSQQQFLVHKQLSDLTIGLLLGLALVLFIYNCFLAFITRQSVFVFYVLYLLNILLYFFVEMGLGFQFVYPNFPQINDMIRIGLLSFSIIPFILFYNGILSVKTFYPSLYRLNNYLAVFFFILFSVGMPAAGLGGYKDQFIWITIFRIISPLIILILWCESVYFLKSKIKYAFYTTVTLSVFILSYLIYGLRENQIIQDNLISANAIILGICLEMIIMTIAVVVRFNAYKNEFDELFLKSQLQQSTIMKSISDFEEKEMQRLSNMLHDSVGARLSAIRFILESGISVDNDQLVNERIKEGAGEIGLLADEVRNFSHQFSPLLLQKKGLINSIHHLVKIINNSKRVHMRFESTGGEDRLDFQNKLIIYYIIYELVQNIAKHAAASDGFLKLIIKKNIISIFIEDNGVGFLTDETTDGLGFTQIKNLMNLVNGQFKIESKLKGGSRFSIEYATIIHEKG